MSFSAYVLVILLVALLGVLITGIVLMGAGNAANLKYGNKLMSARVWLQAAVLVVLAFMFMSSK